jgi:MEMO1 family protein
MHEMKTKLACIILCLVALSSTGQMQQPGSHDPGVRQPVDKVGFATRAYQMDSVMARIERAYGDRINSTLDNAGMQKFSQWKVAICPHDDYSYASWLYPAILRNVKAPTVILIGVAHKAKKYGLEDKMVFGTFDKWMGPYGKVPVSILQSRIMNELPASTWVRHDSLMAEEHSLEAIVPFLQFYNRNVTVIPILVPYMSFKTMTALANSLAKAVYEVMQDNSMMWGKDFAIVISNDAVHYGDEDWGGKNYARFGTDSAGYNQAVQYDYRLITTNLSTPLTSKKIGSFFDTLVNPQDYKEYRWTWCGRYAVPFGLLFAKGLTGFEHTNLKAFLIGYKTSLSDPPLIVDDLKMGTTAIATLRHWVGYAGIGYK